MLAGVGEAPPFEHACDGDGVRPGTGKRVRLCRVGVRGDGVTIPVAPGDDKVVITALGGGDQRQRDGLAGRARLPPAMQSKREKK